MSLALTPESLTKGFLMEPSQEEGLAGLEVSSGVKVTEEAAVVPCNSSFECAQCLSFSIRFSSQNSDAEILSPGTA